MKIFVFCTVFAFACAFPTELNSQIKTNVQNGKVPEVPSAYVHRPLADQQGYPVIKSDVTKGPKTKRDTSVADTKKYNSDVHIASQGHDNTPSSFLRPVPVSQILGKGNHETHSQNTKAKSTDDSTKKEESDAHKPEVPVDGKTKRDTPKAQNLPAKVTDIDTQTAVIQKSQLTDSKKLEVTAPPRKTRDAPKTVTQSQPAVNQKSQVTDSKKPQETASQRKTRDAPNIAAQSQASQTKEVKNVPLNTKTSSEPLKISNQPRTRRDTPKSQLSVDQSKSTIPTGNIQPPQTPSAIPRNPNKAQSAISQEADISRLVRDIPKETPAVKGPTPNPQISKFEIKNNNGEKIQAEKLH